LLFGDEESGEEEEGVEFEQHAEGKGNVGGGPALAFGGDEAEQSESGWQEIEANSGGGERTYEEIESEDES